MGYEDEPDYEGLKNLFKVVMNKNGYVDDSHFDWFNLKVIIIKKFNYLTYQYLGKSTK
jgi:hypothetical protein